MTSFSPAMREYPFSYRHIATGGKTRSTPGRRWALARKILRREIEVEHLPFAVAIGRQHLVGLALLQSRDGVLQQLDRLHVGATAADRRLSGEPAILRQEY